MPTEFRLPELGENIESGTVTKVMVALGDDVAQDQPVVELETDKAVLEVPSSVSGKVAELRVEEGQTLNVGDVIMVLDAASGNGKPQPAEKKAEPAKEPKEAAEKKEAEPRKTEKKQETPKEEKKAEHAEEPPEEPEKSARKGGAASPSVRRLARELDVDLSEVEGTDGRTTADDVRRHAEGRDAEKGPAAAETKPTPDVDAEHEAMSAVRRKTAEHMTEAWKTIPHVTQFDKADVTEIEKFRKQFGPRIEQEGGKLTVTAILVKIVAAALRKFPRFNAVVDAENNEIAYKKQVNIGVAVDTDRGLLVPVIRDADRKNLTALAVEIVSLAEKARAKKIALNEMQGGTFTITNLGGIGGTAFTPIINAPEAAILGVSRARVEAVYAEGRFVPRTMLPLSLSYDHRVIDGADGIRFLRWVVDALEHPLALTLED